MCRTPITLALTVAVAASALAACSSSTAKTAPATHVATTTAAAVATTTVAQPEQDIPTKTRYVVDGQRVDLICHGHGRMPVVFQAGGRESAAVWNGLIAALGENTFTCVFNRPGTTAEELAGAATGHTTPNAVAQTLAATLQQAGIGPRVVLVGHSAGGTDAFVFGHRFPARVAGAVLFDPSVPKLVPAAEWARIGFDGEATVTQTDAVRSWPDVPLVILTADAKLVVANKEATPVDEQAWVEGHKRWASYSARGEQREVPNTSHFVYLTAPNEARDAIREVVTAAT